MSIDPASVAGKAQAVTYVVRGIVNEFGMGKARQEDQTEAEHERYKCGPEDLTSFGSL
jgi:hypothetical protein